MVEEIRTYLLNSKEFSSVVYFPQEYKEVVLNERLSLFRRALLGDSPNDSTSLKAWRASFLTDALYKDPILSTIANSIFDNRLVPNKALIPSDLDPSVTSSNNHTNLMIFTGDLWASFDGVNSKKIVLSKPPGSSPHTSLSVTVSYDGFYKKDLLSFFFTNESSNIIAIQNTPIKVAFTNCTSIPDSFTELTISVQYPYSIDVSSIMSRVKQIPELESIITSSKTASSSLGNIYHTLTRDHQRILCLLVAYACNFKD